MIRTAGGLRKQQVLDLALAPWAPAQLRTYLPVTPSQQLGIEEANSHAHVNQLPVRPCMCPLIPERSSVRLGGTAELCYLLVWATMLCILDSHVSISAQGPTFQQLTLNLHKPHKDVHTSASGKALLFPFCFHFMGIFHGMAGMEHQYLMCLGHVM